MASKQPLQDSLSSWFQLFHMPQKRALLISISCEGNEAAKALKGPHGSIMAFRQMLIGDNEITVLHHHLMTHFSSYRLIQLCWQWHCHYAWQSYNKKWLAAITYQYSKWMWHHLMLHIDKCSHEVKSNRPIDGYCRSRRPFLILLYVLFIPVHLFAHQVLYTMKDSGHVGQVSNRCNSEEDGMDESKSH